MLRQKLNKNDETGNVVVNEDNKSMLWLKVCMLSAIMDGVSAFIHTVENTGVVFVPSL